MQVTRKELIYIHRRIWDEVKNVIHDGLKPDSTDLQLMKDSYIFDMLDKNEVSEVALAFVYRHSSCVFCALYSADFCNNCLLHDCASPESLYQLVLKGSEQACVKIRDLIYEADIPEYIEIPE